MRKGPDCDKAQYPLEHDVIDAIYTVYLPKYDKLNYI